MREARSAHTVSSAGEAEGEVPLLVWRREEVSIAFCYGVAMCFCSRNEGGE